MKLKKLLSAALAACLVLALAATSGLAAEPEMEAQAAEATTFVMGFDWVAENETKEAESRAEVTREHPTKTVSKVFYGGLYDAQGTAVCDMTVRVTGIYSQIENWAKITDITVDFSAHNDKLSYVPTYNGDTATVAIMYDGFCCNIITYHIATNGYISRV